MKEVSLKAFEQHGFISQGETGDQAYEVGPICDALGCARNIYKMTDEQIVEVIDKLDHKQVAGLLRKRLSE